MKKIAFILLIFNAMGFTVAHNNSQAELKKQKPVVTITPSYGYLEEVSAFTFIAVGRAVDGVRLPNAVSLPEATSD